jgi:hypothetical protein
MISAIQYHLNVVVIDLHQTQNSTPDFVFGHYPWSQCDEALVALTLYNPNLFEERISSALLMFFMYIPYSIQLRLPLHRLLV